MISSLLNESQAIGWIGMLAEFAIKGAMILAAAALINLLGRRAAAATRHQIWALALGGMLIAPILGMILPARGVSFLPSFPSQREAIRLEVTPLAPSTQTPAGSTTQIPEASEQIAGGEAFVSLAPSTVSMQTAPEPAWYSLDGLHWPQGLLIVWLLGALFVLGRMALATLAVRACAMNSEYVIDYGWTTTAKNLEARLDLDGHVALLKSPYVSTPMTCGILNPIVLLPLECDDWSEEWRRIVLLHELAHIKRRDCLTQLMAQLVCAVYWFNPLVWFAARQMRAEREMACDDQVLAVGTRPSDYAGHLVEIAKSLGASNTMAPATVGMACSQLESRVRAILNPNAKRRGVNRLKATGLVLGALCLIAPLSMARQGAQPESKKTDSRIDAQQEHWLKSMVGSVLPLKIWAAMAPAGTETTEAQSPSPKPSPNPASNPDPNPQPNPAPNPSGPKVENENDSQNENENNSDNDNDEGENESDAHDAAQDGTKSSELTADQIIQMKQFDITPEYIETMKKQGFENLTVRQLVDLKVHNITQEYINQARGWNDGKLTVRDLVQLKVSGVTPEYIASMKTAGYDKLTLRQVSELKLHGVDPAFIASIKAQGYDSLSVNQIASFKIHGITEDYIKGVQSWLGSKPSVNDLMAIKIHGVTPEFGAKMKALGFENFNIRKLLELKIHGISEEYVKEMRGLGFENLTPEQILKMKIHGVDADYVKKLRASGFKNVSANQMVDMKIHGIDSILLKEGRR